MILSDEVSRMDTTRTAQIVDCWIAEQELPTKANVSIERTADRYFSPTKDMTDDEAESYWEFVHTAMNLEHQTLLSVPMPEGIDFWPVELDENGNNVSAFNTHDFAKLQQFNKYHYRLKKIYERVKDLAITHSCISDDDGKKNTIEKFNRVVEYEFRSKALMLLETYNRHKVWIFKERLVEQIEELNKQIRRCKRIWGDYAYWE